MHNIINTQYHISMQCHQNDFLKIAEIIEGMGLEISYYSNEERRCYKFSEIADDIKKYNSQQWIQAAVHKKDKFVFQLSSCVNREYVILLLPFEYVYEIYTRLDKRNFNSRDLKSSKLPLFYNEKKRLINEFRVTLYRFRINAKYLYNSEIDITYLFEYEPVVFKTGRICSVVSSKDKDIFNQMTSQFLHFTDLL